MRIVSLDNTCLIIKTDLFCAWLKLLQVMGRYLFETPDIIERECDLKYINIF